MNTHQSDTSTVDPAADHVMHSEKWAAQSLSIIVFGASGDLAKKKTYPALFDIFQSGFFCKETKLCGYARSSMTNDAFRAKLKPFLITKGSPEELVDEFLQLCFYISGQYDNAQDIEAMSAFCKSLHNTSTPFVENRVFYLALPPSVFMATARTLHSSGMSASGFNRIIVEKPFGHDTESARKLSTDLGQIFSEEYLYRIDHYLGKEMVQNLIVLRFGNSLFEPIWNRDNVSSVTITFKEDIGTQGRGGYFDGYGIIRDVMQNHLMQVLSIVAMEPPIRVAGHNYSDFVRDEKVKVLRCVEPWTVENMVLGQYVTNGKEPGYLDDSTVPAGSTQPTYCAVVFKINNRRWEGVPFIMKAGKALDSRKAEIRLQLRTPPGADAMFDKQDIPRNEIVVRLQPDEAVYMKTNVKKPGLTTEVIQSELDLTYQERYCQIKLTDAYTRLVLDTIRGKQATFVRNDELIAAWEIVTPCLKEIESKRIKPIPYVFGSRGPVEGDQLVERMGGYVRHDDYKWSRDCVPCTKL